ncbi:YihY/virulence factor BrkB family protein [uncultured Tateyamaria sp.]|uniref:YihY/virulence factor BrkB family protein n=1 Tax=uncultured Tateyamaria sp. TaxID=455651 RepID=UPI002605508A|nr:YihY/virulence factor BrkB family protein [uncultured Tateyamaria sp.]
MSRGRDAQSPTGITPQGWLDIGWRIWTRVSKHSLGLIAAGIAFYGLLSLFPAITASVALVGLIFDPTLLLEHSQFLLAALPEAAAEIISTQLRQVAGAGDEPLGWTALIATALALWSASKAVGSLMQGLNIINDETETRGIVRLKAVTVALTLSLLLVLVLSVIVVAAIPTALVFVGVSQQIADLALVLRWPVMFAIGTVSIAVMYRYGPSRRAAQWRWLSLGALLACALWVAGSYGFSLYVESFGAYNRTFGALAGVVIVLTWLWLSAFVVLLGALLDAELEAQTKHDTTVGPARPMGARGAYKADTLGETFRENPQTQGTINDLPR